MSKKRKLMNILLICLPIAILLCITPAIVAADQTICVSKDMSNFKAENIRFVGVSPINITSVSYIPETRSMRLEITGGEEAMDVYTSFTGSTSYAYSLYGPSLAPGIGVSRVLEIPAHETKPYDYKLQDGVIPADAYGLNVFNSRTFAI